MSKSVQDFQSSKSVFVSTLKKLEQDVKTVETYELLMALKTDGYLKAIQDQKPPYENSNFYIIRWFRTFVGIKDEAMVLINGELVRKYHQKQHEQYLHTRGKETKYYKTGENLSLSSCSIDGLNYQYRQLMKSLQKKEEERLNALGDKISELEARLDSLCKAVDAKVVVMKTELKKRCPYIRSVTIETKHKSEHLDVRYDPKLTATKDLQYVCKEARKVSRKLALHSGIEDPTSDVAMPAVPVSHYRAAVADEEDLEYAQQVAAQKAAAALAEKRAKEREAQKAPDFHFDYSIDKEKREFGAYELLAVPEDRHAYDDDDMVIVDDEGLHSFGAAHETLDNAGDQTQWQFRPVPLDQQLSGLITTAYLKIKLYPHGIPAAGSAAASLVKTVVPGTEITLFRHRGSLAVSHIHLTVEVNVANNFAELKHQSGTNSNCSMDVRVQEVLEEVHRQLWLGPADNMLHDTLHLPGTLRINNTEYGPDDVVALPEAAELSKKRYLVKVDSRPRSSEVLSSVVRWMNSKLDVSSLMQARSLLWSQRHLVRRIVDKLCDEIHTNATPELGAPVPPLLLLNDTSLIPPVEEEAGEFRSFLDAVLSGSGARQLASNISISGSAALSGHLAELLPHASELHAVSSGISFLHLQQCAAQLTQRVSQNATPAASVTKALSLRRLDLSHNRFLSYCDAPWELLALPAGATSVSVINPDGAWSVGRGASESAQTDSEPMDLDADGLEHGNFNRVDPFEEFATVLFGQCALLECVDLSHCATSEKQARCLCGGLLRAVKARASTGLSPVRQIVLTGLEAEFPSVVMHFRNSFNEIGLGQTIACTGVSMCI